MSKPTEDGRHDDVDPFMLHIYAALAQKERHNDLRADTRRFAENVVPVIREMQTGGLTSLRGIAAALNARGVGSAPKAKDSTRNK